MAVTTNEDGARVLRRLIYPLTYSSLTAEQKTAFDSAAALQHTFMERYGENSLRVKSESVGDVRVELDSASSAHLITVGGIAVSPSALMALCDAGLIETWA